jgi:hypothetical protein
MSLSPHPIRALLFSDIHRFVMHSALWRFLYLVSLVCGILFGQIYNSTIQRVVYSRQCLLGVVQFHRSQFAVQMATVASTPFHRAKGHYGDGNWSPVRPGRRSCKRGVLGPAPGRSRVRTRTRSAFAPQGLVSEIASGRCFSVTNQERDVSLEESSRFQESIFCTPFLARCRVLD